MNTDVKCPIAAFAAASPTTGPTRAETTGIATMASMLRPSPASPGIYVAPMVKSTNARRPQQYTSTPADSLDAHVATLPPPLEPSSNRI